ncbi:TcpQ domain-containing protein [Azonexus hydrophilus]|uniref:TcpQ domain-containing protein n=1 Tax=Azonexus hydrophilus TaxID=418702 RepID=A0ABZ2XNH6_9RHOO
MKKLIGIALATLVMVGNANADYVNETPRGEVKVIGQLDRTVKAYGLGNGATLGEALRQIIPHDFSTNYSGLLRNELDAQVSWKGGRMWADVLRDTVKNVPVLIEIDAGAKTVRVWSSSQTTAIAGAQSTWVIKRGDRISEALQMWAKLAGWNGLYWEAPEMMSALDGDAAFTGTFEEALEKVLEAVGGVRAEMYANKVVKIVEKK